MSTTEQRNAIRRILASKRIDLIEARTAYSKCDPKYATKARRLQLRHNVGIILAEIEGMRRVAELAGVVA